MSDDKAMRAPLLLTVGHSTASVPEFVLLLKQGFVGTVADVRRHPGSRRNPQFGSVALARSLETAGIGYRSFAELLGGRRTAKDAGPAHDRDAVDNAAWRHPSFRAYADYMATPDFQRGLEALEACALEQRTAIMCAEAHPSRCHRRLIADAMLARGWRVFHLMRGRAAAEHLLSEHAVLSEGRLSYPTP